MWILHKNSTSIGMHPDSRVCLHLNARHVLNTSSLLFILWYIGQPITTIWFHLLFWLTNVIPTIKNLFKKGLFPLKINPMLLKLSSYFGFSQVIRRDIARTYPEHEFFKKKDGFGQEALFNVMKAYSIHDREVGYCQGSAFIVGLLLMQVSSFNTWTCPAHQML